MTGMGFRRMALAQGLLEASRPPSMPVARQPAWLPYNDRAGDDRPATVACRKDTADGRFDRPG